LSAGNHKTDGESVLVLGIGNVLMADEGVGVQIVRELEKTPLPPNVECLDGGTGGFQLLGPLQDADRILLIDACVDGQPAGTVQRLQPRFSSDYPRTLTAHDIGLKDLLDTAYLTDRPLNLTLFAISIDPLQGVGMELRPALANQLPEILKMVRDELFSTRASGEPRRLLC
jgi:hydrogenase maturation protease